MSDLFQSMIDYFAPKSPQVVAQDRYMRTPITQGQQLPGAGASYDSRSNSISAAGPLKDLPPGLLAHEAVHRIFSQAGLVKVAPMLSQLVPKMISDYIQQSPLYNQSQIAGSPEQISNEGLSFAATNPVMQDKSYVQAAAAQIKDPKLKETLMRIFANRAAASGGR